ncbi:MAG: hypothetical protein ACRCX2_28420 [Paraclostridium sp.]
MKEMSGATCSDKYDFVLTNDGMLSVEVETASALASILKLDMNSNNDWDLDEDLGIHWVSADNTGLLQVKGSEAQMISAIHRKLIRTEGVRDVESIEISKGLNRKIYMKVVVIAVTGEELVIEREV